MSSRQTGVARSGNALVLLVAQELEANVPLIRIQELFDDGHASVGGVVVNQDALKAVVGLVHDRLKTIGNEFLYLVDRYND